MKMFLKSMMALLALVFVMGSYDAQAQCPTGYTTETFTETMLVDFGKFCDVKVTICTKTWTDVNGVRHTEVLLNSFDFLDPDCIEGVDISNGYFQQSLKDAIFRSNVIDINPCTEPMTAVYILSRANCYNTSKIMTAPIQGQSWPIIRVTACLETGVNCKKSYHACIDFTQNPPQYIYSSPFNIEYPPNACPSYGWTIPSNLEIYPVGEIIPCQPFCP